MNSRRNQLFLLVAALGLGVGVWYSMRRHGQGAAHEPEAAEPGSRSFHEESLRASAEGAGRELAVPPDIALGTGMRLTFLSASDEGLPVPGVLVHEGSEVIGTSDAGGTCALSVSPLEVAVRQLVATADGYCTTDLDLREAADGRESFVFHLEESAALWGTVRWAAAEPVTEESHVIAWPDGQWLSDDLTRLGLEGAVSERLHHARADEEGRFRIEGLSPRVSYRLLAFGCGLLSPSEPAPLFRPEGSPVDLMVQRVYGAIVHVRGPEGEPLKTSPRLLGQGPSWDSRAGSARSRFVLPGYQALFDVCQPEVSALIRGTRRLSWQSTLLLYTAQDGAQAEIGPLDFSVTVPGYEPVRASLRLAPLGSGPASIVLTPRPRSTCFGAARVVVRIPALSTADLPGTLTLRSATDGSLTYSVAMDLADPESCEIDGIPCDSYEVVFRARDSYYEYPAPGTGPLLVEIRSSEPCRIPVDVRDAGALDVQLVGETGRTYQGGCVLSLLRGPENASVSSLAELSPRQHVLGLVAAGSYRVRIESSSADCETLEPTTPAEVVAGRTTVVVIPIRRTRR